MQDEDLPSDPPASLQCLLGTHHGVQLSADQQPKQAVIASMPATATTDTNDYRHSWPDSLTSHQAVYKKCTCSPLSWQRVVEQRWTIYSAMSWEWIPRPRPRRPVTFTTIGSARYQGRRGRRCANLLELLRADVKQAGLGSPNTERQLRKLRDTFEDKFTWNNSLKSRDWMWPHGSSHWGHSWGAVF